MMPPINIDSILSDPLLIVASILLVVSPIVFLVALLKFLRAPRVKTPFAIPHDDLSSPVASLAPHPERKAAAPEPDFMSAPAPVPDPEPVPVRPIPPAPPAPAAIPDAERTMVLPPGTGEMQGQLEIALTQVRTLNKKIYDLETTVSALVRSSGAAGGTIAGASSDVATKLQTLAEHVIILEKDVARLKAAAPSDAPAQSMERRPPMPL